MKSGLPAQKQPSFHLSITFMKRINSLDGRNQDNTSKTLSPSQPEGGRLTSCRDVEMFQLSLESLQVDIKSHHQSGTKTNKRKTCRFSFSQKWPQTNPRDRQRFRENVQTHEAANEPWLNWSVAFSRDNRRHDATS